MTTDLDEQRAWRRKPARCCPDGHRLAPSTLRSEDCALCADVRRRVALRAEAEEFARRARTEATAELQAARAAAWTYTSTPGAPSIISAAKRAAIKAEADAKREAERVERAAWKAAQRAARIERERLEREGRKAKKPTHCRNGHDLATVGTVRERGRLCRQCKLDKERRYRERRRAAGNG